MAGLLLEVRLFVVVIGRIDFGLIYLRPLTFNLHFLSWIFPGLLFNSSLFSSRTHHPCLVVGENQNLPENGNGNGNFAEIHTGLTVRH